MIYGIGVDIVSNERIKLAYERFGNKFLKKILTEQEINYCLSHKDPIPHIAVRFAAKEAIIKALMGNARFRDIEIISRTNRSPEALIHSRTNLRVHISLSHEKTYSIAFAVLVTNLIN